MKQLFFCVMIVVVSLGVVACDPSQEGALPFAEARLEQVSIVSGSIRLSGELVLPEGAGPFPAVLQVGGSMSTPKEHIAARAHAYALAEQGIATLTYDKRGNGGSEGQYFPGDYRNFIKDIHAAFDSLKIRPDIAADHLCYIGHSEGGFLMPEVVFERDDIRCAYLRVSPVRRFSDLQAFQIGHRLQQRGLPSKDIHQIVRLLDDLQQFYQRVLTEPSYFDDEEHRHLNQRAGFFSTKYRQLIIDVLPSPLVVSTYNRAFIERQVHQYSYSASTFLEKGIGIPLLYVFGELDKNIDSEASVTYLQGLSHRYHQSIETHIYPGEDHSLIRKEYLPQGGYPPGYYRRMTDWISDKIGKP